MSIATANLAADARNRALRTFLQGLAIDLLAALGAYLLPIVTTWSAPDDIEWKVLAFGLAKTAVQTVVSYAMRRFLDGSSIPTPLPPSDPGPPAEPAADTVPDEDDQRFPGYGQGV